ncbi:MAG: DUF2288 family protein, partial [Pseudomonadota bacterium]
KLIAETARTTWSELERFYAQGKLILVCTSLDLVEVAYQLSIDNTDQTKDWIESKKLLRDFNVQAKAFSKGNCELWCVVVKPWILIQPIEAAHI